MKCDLHVHTHHSGSCGIPVLDAVCQESYNQPSLVYRELKARGMDLVTITDHDSVGALADLGHYSDFFISEEVTCLTPHGTKFHMGVYDITERDHVELQRRRTDFWALMAYLNERGLFYSIKHPFSALTGPRLRLDYMLFQDAFPAAEIHNGHMLASANQLARQFATLTGQIMIGGSDSHSMRTLATGYTEVPGARNKHEFFRGLKAGHGIVHGSHGSLLRLTQEIMSIAMAMIAERPFLAPALLGTPIVLGITLSNYLRERWFLNQWSRTIWEVVSVPLPSTLADSSRVADLASQDAAAERVGV